MYCIELLACLKSMTRAYFKGNVIQIKISIYSTFLSLAGCDKDNFKWNATDFPSKQVAAHRLHLCRGVRSPQQGLWVWH